MPHTRNLREERGEREREAEAEEGRRKEEKFGDAALHPALEERKRQQWNSWATKLQSGATEFATGFSTKLLVKSYTKNSKN